MDLEQAMTEGRGIMAGDHTDEELEDIRDKSRLNLLRINNSILADLCVRLFSLLFVTFQLLLTRMLFVAVIFTKT